MELSAKPADPSLSARLDEKSQTSLYGSLLGLEIAHAQSTFHQLVVDFDVGSHVPFVCIDS